MSTVCLERQGNLGIIRIDNPPVNAISHAVRQGLWDAITSIQEDDSIRAAILICAGRTFIAGAEASELGNKPVPPHLNDLVLHIENCRKPITAAIHGNALGGGLEVALGCSYRVATSDAKFGLPEVKLGFVPGAGGTQRLPRLIGVEAALRMAVEGRPVTADQAVESGLIDRITKDLEPEAVEFSHRLAGSVLLHRKLNQPIAEGSFDKGLFDVWRAICSKRRHGVIAPRAVINAVEAATTHSFQDGLKKERALSLELRQSPQSRALRHIFFAERKSTKIASGQSGLTKINSVAVIGSGTMGAGIALFFATSGMPVKLVEISEDAANAGIDRIVEIIAQSVKRNKMTEVQGNDIMARIAMTVDYEDLSQVDLVVEAAVENMEIKKKIFSQLHMCCKSDAILATNTSYLDINEIASASGRPKRVVGLHFFSPAHVMKLVEIVRTDCVDPAVIATIASTMKQLGKIGVFSGVCQGFIGNRLYQCYQREAGLILLETGSPDIVDSALRQFGMAMGPFQVLDLSGIDIGYLMRKSLPVGSVHPFAFQVHDELVEMGRKGLKSKAGFYDYTNNNPSVDNTIKKLIHQVASEYNITRRSISANEIAERCAKALAVEGDQILAEGIAEKSGDIDVVFVNGYGFPRHLGGPMYRQEL